MSRKMLAGLCLALLLAACGQPTGTTAPTAAPAETTAAPAQATAPAETTAAPAEATASPAEATAAPASGEAQTLVVMSHDSFNVSAEVIKQFEQANNATVKFLPSGDAGAALNKAILSKDSPQADIFFGVDNTFLSRAVAAGIFEPYESPALASVPATYKLDPSNQLLPIDFGYVSLNYDKAAVPQLPTSLKDLTKPEWKDKLVVENPATSSPGLAFLLATVNEFGTEGDYTWADYWKDLRANGVHVSEGWDDAYNKEFSGASGKGPFPLVVSYASSPPAEVIFSETPLTEAPTGVLDIGSFLQIEYAGILKGSKNRALAEKFIDFMLSKPFQEDMPLQMFVYPVQPDAALPEAFTKYAELPKNVKTPSPEEINQNRDAWIDTWTQTVLR